MASVWQSVRGRSAAVAVLAVLAVASCSPHAPDEAKTADNTVADDATPVPRSALGDFLAARLAHAHGDTKAAAEFYASALAHDPDNVELMQRAFTLMVAEGKLDAATPLAERLVALDADSPMPILVLGVRDAREGHFAQADARFATLPKRGVNAFLSPLLSAWALAGEGRTDAALEALTPLTQNAGLKSLHAFHSGLINDLADRSVPADDQYKVALAGQLNIRTVEAAGSLAQRTGHADHAKDLYDRYRAEHPETMLFDGGKLLQAGIHAPRPVADAKAGLAEAMFDLASLMRQGNANDYAMVFCRLALALQPDFPLAQMTAADLLSAQGRVADANALYRAIDPASPVHAFGRLRVAINLDESGDSDGALAELSRLAQERPDNLDALVTMGDVHRRHKQYDDAAKDYTGALARTKGDQPDFWALYYSRGIAYERADQWPKAEADFQKALQLQPDQPDVLNYLGYSWIDKGMNLDQGRKMIERAVELRPDDGAIIDSLGWALYRMGDFQGAVKNLEHAVALKPEDSTINEHLGDAYWRAGRLSEAAYQWNRSMALGPEPEQMDALKEKINTGELPAKSVEH